MGRTYFDCAPPEMVFIITEGGEYIGEWPSMVPPDQTLIYTREMPKVSLWDVLTNLCQGDTHKIKTYPIERYVCIDMGYSIRAIKVKDREAGIELFDRFNR